MDRRILGGLINSISRFIHLVACQGTKTSVVFRDLRNMVAVLKSLKPVLDEVYDCQIPSNEKLLETFEELDVLVNEAREILEKQPPQMSKLYSAVRCGKLVMKQTIQEIQCADQGSVSELIENALRDQKENTIYCQELIMRIAESIGLMSNHELFIEHIALEKEREKAELKMKKDETEVFYEVIELFNQISICVAKLDQYAIKNGLAVPSYFRCYLSLEMMVEPVILASGQTYEKQYIKKWLDHGLKLCPKTRQSLSHTNLVPNDTVKTLIVNWCQENGTSLGQSNRSSKELFPCLSSMVIEDVSHCHGSLGRDSMCRQSCEVRNEPEQQQVGAFHLNSEGKNLSIVPYKSNSLPEKNPYSHCHSDSVSSFNSTSHLLSKSANRTNLSAIAVFSSTKDVVLSPQLPVGSIDCSEFRNGNGPTDPSFSAGSGSDGPIASFHIQKLIEDLNSHSSEAQMAATLDLRLLTKDKNENRVVIAKCGAITPLISLLYSKVKKTQENAVTALLNLSINNNDNKISIAESGAIEPLIYVLKYGSTEAKENSAAALFSLSIMEECRMQIGRSGAAKPLVDLLRSGTLRGKKDAAAALFNLSILHENKHRIVQAGAPRYLVEMLDPETGMIDKAVALLASLSTIPEGCVAISHEGGIPLLVEVIESGSQRGKENAASALLQLCIHSQKLASMVLQEGAVPPLIALSQQGTPRAKEKAQQILSHFRSQREGVAGKGKPCGRPA